MAPECACAAFGVQSMEWRRVKHVIALRERSCLRFVEALWSEGLRALGVPPHRPPGGTSRTSS